MGEFVYGDWSESLPIVGEGGMGGERKRQGLKPNEKRVKPGGREDREG